MRYTYLKRDISAGNPIANFLVVVAGIIAIAVAIVIGFFAFVALAGIVLVTAAVIGVRVWWLQRKLGGRVNTASSHGGQDTAPPADVIEGEYRVVKRDRDGP